MRFTELDLRKDDVTKMSYLFRFATQNVKTLLLDAYKTQCIGC